MLIRKSFEINKYMARSFAPSRPWLVPLLGFILAFGFSGMLCVVFPDNVRLERNLWFGADIVSVIRRMTDPGLSGRTNVHPLFALFC